MEFITGKILMLSFLFISTIAGGFHFAFSDIDVGHVSVIQSLKDEWENLPANWFDSNCEDPCADLWTGITCNGSKIVELNLGGLGITGQLIDAIGGLTDLIHLNLSHNPGMTGPLSPKLGDLQNLKVLYLVNCNFTGSIPNELLHLTHLEILEMSGNGLSGEIPEAICNLKSLVILELSVNKLCGEIPNAIWNLKSLQKLGLAWNLFTGSIPSTINALTSLDFLTLGGNELTGPLPDLNGMNSLRYVDLSLNKFEESEAPTWLKSLPSLKEVIMVKSSLVGCIPSEIFNLPNIELVDMRGNAFDGTLDLTCISKNLKTVDFTNNDISTLKFDSENITIYLAGNPYCECEDANEDFCET